VAHQITRVSRENLVQSFPDEIDSMGWNPEQEHARSRRTQADRSVAKALIVSDQDTTVRLGSPEDQVVGLSLKLLRGGQDVVAVRAKSTNDLDP
jgi:hypothetical protein